MSKSDRKSRLKSRSPKSTPKGTSLTLTKILGAAVGLFVLIYLFELAVSSYFAPPPEYSQEYKDTYKQISEQDR